MHIVKKEYFIYSLLAVFIVFNATGYDAAARGRGARHHGPPPEAYTACEGKNAGDSAEFVSPRGDTVTGICEEEDARLVLRPDNPPDRRRQGDVDD